MKKYIVYLLFLLVFSHSALAQSAIKARKVMDRVAAVVGRSGGASAHFSISGGRVQATSGTLAIKGNKFHARTPQAIVWFDGKTQWTYLKQTNEVNVSTPSEAKRVQMNPYTFISLYKQGYTLSMKQKGATAEIQMKAQNKRASVQQAFITVNTRTYVPSKIRVLQNGQWLTITISQFKARNQSNATFTFRQKDFPQAEVIDLR